MERLSEGLAKHIARGLGDNWSQVRFAASVAARSFCLGTDSNDGTAEVRAYAIAQFSVLVPRMCLNRYYVAEGVRLYSIESWALVMKAEGKALLARHIAETVTYYVSQSNADNHAVREAACHCIAEIALKVDTAAVRPHVTELIDVRLPQFCCEKRVRETGLTRSRH